MTYRVPREHVIRLADFVASAVNDPAVRSHVKWFWLSNYAENIATWATGSPEKAVLFIRHCLNYDSKVEVSALAQCGLNDDD